MPNNPKRHGCLTAWLIFGLVANILTFGLNVVGAFLPQTLGQLGSKLPSEPQWYTLSYCGISAALVVCGIFLLRWKKWAFFGFVAISVVAIILHAIGKHSVLSGLSAFINPVIIYLLLQIGGEHKAWKYLQ